MLRYGLKKQLLEKVKHLINKKNITALSTILIFGVFLIFNSCKETTKKSDKEEVQKIVYASDVISFSNHWKLILGDGSNAGYPINFEHKDFFFTANDGDTDWVVYKTPNGGDTHGTSNNTRTELAQTRKWYPKTANDKLSASLKVMNVSSTGDARVAASYSVVVGQIHSADGHENEPLKIFYKKFPGHTKGSVFWHYEINTAGDDNSGRWDYSTAVWGYDFSVVGSDLNSYPEEPENGIELGEEFSYEIEVKDGIMNLKFASEGHETKSFTKNLVESEYSTAADIPEQTQKLFVPIGQDGVERENAYADEGLFFKLGSYNQTNGKSPEENKNWCSGAETHGGDIQKQYGDGNYAEVWFNKVKIYVGDDSVSNEGYFTKND
ncbi:MAG: polysaccharide lyase family 7 protein [Flavobacteriaceae bacterium]|nr:polysaccharide lyase family 7 protein [Flavobacteriaceae bacterium]